MKFVIIIIIFMISCQEKQNISELDNIEKFKYIMYKESWSIPFIKSGKFISVDKEIKLNQGSVFIVQSYSGDEKIYSFWAMEQDTSKIKIWAFGGVFWGLISDRYNKLSQLDSLPVLIEKGEWWKDERIWNTISKEREEYGIIEYEY